MHAAPKRLLVVTRIDSLMSCSIHLPWYFNVHWPRALLSAASASALLSASASPCYIVAVISSVHSSMAVLYGGQKSTHITSPSRSEPHVTICCLLHVCLLSRPVVFYIVTTCSMCCMCCMSMCCMSSCHHAHPHVHALYNVHTINSYMPCLCLC